MVSWSTCPNEKDWEVLLFDNEPARDPPVCVIENRDLTESRTQRSLGKQPVKSHLRSPPPRIKDERSEFLFKRVSPTGGGFRRRSPSPSNFWPEERNRSPKKRIEAELGKVEQLGLALEDRIEKLRKKAIIHVK